MLLITETYDMIFQLEESEAVGKRRKLRGLFHLAETKNANGRIYSKSLLERELKKLQGGLTERRILGELDHPDDPRIHLDKVSHVITKLKMDGIKMFGELETLDTPAGQILEGLINSGVKLGISSRGLGSLRQNEDGINLVQNDYNLITWDVVPNPSTPSAWLGESSIFENEDFSQPRKITLAEFKNRINRTIGG